MDASWWATAHAQRWIREGRQALGLSQDEFADRLREDGEAGLSVDGHQVGRWERGNHAPGPKNRRALRRVLGEPPWERATRDERAGATIFTWDSCCGKLHDVDRTRRKLLQSIGLTSLGAAAGLQPWQLKMLVPAVAQESVERAALAELSNVGPAALEQLHANVIRVARAYVTSPAISVFAELVGARDQVFERLVGRQHPAQTADLHLLAGQLCGLLAAASLDLGYREAAAEQARAAWAYAETIGHDGLRAWARGTQSLIAYWSERPGDAVALAESGQAYSPAGAALARLHSLEARARARIGDHAEATRAINRAQEVHGRASDDLHDSVGGEFEFGRAKLAYYAADTFLEIGDLNRGAEEAQRAIDLYRSGRPEQRSYGCEAGAFMDLASAQIRQGELDGASATLMPVLNLPSTHHIEPFAQALRPIRDLLSQPPHHGASAARELHAQIDSFYAQLPRALSAANPE